MTALRDRLVGTMRRYTPIVLYRTYADLRSESERTYIGFLWWVIEPIISMIVYYVVFSVIIKRGTENFVAFLFAGLVPWRWFQATILGGSNAILRARGLLQQVYLPKLVFPLISVLTDTVKFLFALALLVIFFAVSGFPVGLHYLALVPILAVQGLLITALTILAAGIAPFLPDIRLVLQNVVRLLFFLSGVFYDVSVFGERAQFYLRLNPMTVLIEAYRSVLMRGTWPDLAPLALFALLSALLLVVAAVWMGRFDRLYPKLSF